MTFALAAVDINYKLSNSLNLVFIPKALLEIQGSDMTLLSLFSVGLSYNLWETQPPLAAKLLYIFDFSDFFSGICFHTKYGLNGYAALFVFHEISDPFISVS